MSIREDNLTLEMAGLRVYEARANLGVAVETLYPQASRVGASLERWQLSGNAEPISYLPGPVRNAVTTDFSNYRADIDLALRSWLRPPGPCSYWPSTWNNTPIPCSRARG